MERSLYHRSFAMEQSFEQAVKVSGLKGLGDIDLIDLYSVSPPRPLSPLPFPS